MELVVNGERYAVATDSDRSLLHVLREDLGLTGAKPGCGEGACGACTVLLDGDATPACVTPVGTAAGRRVTTIEGLAAGGLLHPVQRAFVDVEAMQCGFCTPGMIMSAVGLLNANPQPTDDDVVAAMQGNICRCGAYSRIATAIRRAARASR